MHNRTGKKSVSLPEFRNGKERPGARSKPWPSHREQKVSSKEGCTDAVCCAPYTRGPASASGPLQPLSGASRPLLLLKLFTFFPPPLPLSILKKKTLPLFSPSPLWVATPFVSVFGFASLSFPPRISSTLAPSFDGARWCF